MKYDNHKNLGRTDLHAYQIETKELKLNKLGPMGSLATNVGLQFCGHTRNRSNLIGAISFLSRFSVLAATAQDNVAIAANFVAKTYDNSWAGSACPTECLETLHGDCGNPSTYGRRTLQATRTEGKPA